MRSHLDLFLPEWQGYGQNSSVFDGAHSLRDQLSPPLSFTGIAVSPHEKLDVENDILGYRANLRLLTNARDSIAACDPATIFLIGGTCASEIAPVSFLNRKYRGDLTVLWLDAHGDLNTPRSSVSKRLHGMPLRMLLGDGPEEIQASMFSHLSPSQVILGGSRDLDPPEVAYMKTKEISSLSVSALGDWNELGRAVETAGSSNLYIHVDLDVLEPQDFPHLLIPTAGGIRFDDLVGVLARLKGDFTIVGSSIVEYVPLGEGDPERMERLAALLRPSGLA